MSPDRATACPVAILPPGTNPLRFSDLRTPPNLVSLGRIAGATLTLAFLAKGYLSAGLLLGMATCLSDHLDGFLARRLGQSSALGALLDQTADSYSTGVFLFWLCSIGGISYFALAFFLLREFWVAGLRRQVALAGIEIPSAFIGKLATAVIYWGLFLTTAMIVWPPPQPWQWWLLSLGRAGIVTGLGFSGWAAVRYSLFAVGSGR